MTSSTVPIAAPPADSGSAPSPRGAKFALAVVSLLWPAQLSSLIGLLTGNAQAKVALHFHTTQIIWFQLSTVLVGSLIGPFVIRAADRYGKRRLMISCVVLGLVGDVIAAMAGSFGILLVGRAIAGIYIPVAALSWSAIREVFPAKQAATVSSVIGSGIALVAIGGPFLTGWLLDAYGFHGVLWALVVATFIALLLLIVALPDTPFRDPSARVDWIGGTLLGGGLTALAYGLAEGGGWGWTSGRTLAWLIGGSAAMIAFVPSQAIVPHPMVKISMLRRRAVWSVFLATALAAGAIYGSSAITQLLAFYPKIVIPYPVPQTHTTVMVHMSDGLGMSATHFAIIGLPSSISILLLGLGTGFLVRKVDVRLPFAVGALLTSISFILQAAYHYNTTQLVIVGLFWALGFGMLVSTIPVLVIKAVRPHEQVMGNGLQGMAAGVAMTLATTFTFVILNHHGKVLQGTQLYLDQGYKDGFYLGAGIAFACLLATFLIPRLHAVQSEDEG